MTKPKKLSDGELEVMLAVWDADGPVTGNYVLERMRGKRSWVLSTLMTVLARLVEKGYLACDRSTRTNYYAPLVDEMEYKARESSTFLERMYGNSLPGLVAGLYKGGAVGDRDLAELREFLDTAGKGAD
ncbi:MAG TPA: BlaI/MecI/CopY family transcriptional regulator [Oscillospiraceae bacterium]|nr:BlaI/MecI/CopY family transcriptional regulator [Oscillospiraceae bacterium]HPW00352.1 BlaI/MecI/CopY family transcriptional regulator [Oscillospiraceae bacterium]